MYTVDVGLKMIITAAYRLDLCSAFIQDCVGYQWINVDRNVCLYILGFLLVFNWKKSDLTHTQKMSSLCISDAVSQYC